MYNYCIYLYQCFFTDFSCTCQVLHVQWEYHDFTYNPHNNRCTVQEYMLCVPMSNEQAHVLAWMVIMSRPSTCTCMYIHLYSGVQSDSTFTWITCVAGLTCCYPNWQSVMDAMLSHSCCQLLHSPPQHATTSPQSQGGQLSGERGSLYTYLVYRHIYIRRYRKGHFLP